MEPVIHIGSWSVPLYGLLYYSGIFIACLTAYVLSRKHLPAYDLVCSSIYAVLCGVAGAKLLFVLVSLPQIIEQNVPFSVLLKGGFVFYGGLFGGMVGLFLYCKQFRLAFWDYAGIYACVLPLGHALGRVGCHAAGCCYGRPYDGPFAVTYQFSYGQTPLGVSLFPVQLLEAVLLVILSGLLIALYRYRRRRGQLPETAPLYAICYAVLRFFIEMLRYDGERGSLWIFSTSQWISFALLLLGIGMLWRWKKKRGEEKK